MVSSAQYQKVSSKLYKQLILYFLRYGFHGTSHDYVVRKTIELLQESNKDGARIVSCHLGAGCSVAASVLGEGSSRDTSMGFSPLSGVMMGTRCGDIDPSIVTYMAHR